MRTLLLGATGSVGGAVLPELLRVGHSVLALARSDAAERQLVKNGADVVRGDLRNPKEWSESILEVDAVIHVAATFTDDMGDVDHGVVQELIAQGKKANRRIRFVYTGGVWLYGQTGDSVATEDTPFNPIPSFTWMVRNSTAILNAPCFSANVIHPGMSYVRDGGVFSRFTPKDGSIEVWGSLDTRWPVVHRDDLASAYRLVLENGPSGEAYNVCAEQGVRVGDIVNMITKCLGVQIEPSVRSVVDLTSEHGEWAVGPTLDQQMSSQKIRDSLGWEPVHTDVLSELA